MKFRPLPLAAALLLTATVWAQAPAAVHLTFDAVSIKPSPDITTVIAGGGAPHVGTKIDAARVDIGFASLKDLIVAAYEVKPYQVEGPDWMTSSRFDILATMPTGATKEQVPALLQAMLADRFKLTIHRDSRDEQVYALLVGKDGSKLVPALPPAVADAPAAPLGKDEKAIDTPAGQMRVKTSGSGDNATMEMSGSGPNGPMKMSMAGGMMHLETGSMTMDELAQAMTQFLDHPVVNKTGIEGKYQVTLDLSMADMMAAAQKMTAGMGLPAGPGMAALAGGTDAAAPPGQSIFASVEKLGLKLESQKSPVALIVVDHLEKTPTAN